MIQRRFKGVLSFLLAILLSFTVFTPQVVRALPLEEIGKGDVVFHQIYGGGGNSNAHYLTDFVVLYNQSEQDVDLTGWTIQYASATGNFSGSNTVFTLSGTIKAKDYLLVSMADGNNKDAAPLLVGPDLSGKIAMGGSNLKLLLSSDATPVASAAQPSQLVADYPNIVDYVGAGSATAWLGTAKAPALSNTTLLQRVAYTGNNSEDYQVVTADQTALTYLIDKDTLKQEIDKANAVVPTGYVSTTYDAVVSAKDAAQLVYDDVDATQEEVVTAHLSVYNALYNLRADMTALNAKIAEAQAFQAADYTEPTFAALTAAITAAQKFITRTQVTPAEVSAEVVKLQTAINNLVPVTPTDPVDVDKTALQAKIAEAEAIDLSTYTTASAQNLTNAIAAAKLVYDDVNATQAQVDQQVVLLTNAITDLVDATSGATVNALTIAEARALANGTLVKGSGTITYKDGRSLYLQDDTAAIVYRVVQATADQYAVGDNIDFIGVVGEFNSLKQVENDGTTYNQIRVNSQNNVITPKEVTVAELLSNGEAYEAQLVKITNATLGALSGDNLPVTQNGSTINIYRGPSLPYAEGTNVNVTAVVTQYHGTDPTSGYQLKVADASWVQEILPEGVLTIAEARKLADATPVKIQGIITGIASDRMWIEDATDAMLLFKPTSTETIAVGDKVTVEGNKATYNNLVQIGQGGVITKLSSGNPLPPVLNVTISEIEANISMYESHRVSIKNLTLTTLNTAGTSVFTDSELKTIDAYRMQTPSDPEIVQGSVVNVVGFVDNFRGTDQLRFTSADDVTLVPMMQDPISDEETVGLTNLLEAQTATGTVTVIGSVAYKYGGNSILLQDTINGEIFGLQIYDFPNFDKYVVGDVVKVTGTVSPYGGVPQVGSVTTIEVVRADTPYKPQEVTIQELKDGKDAYLSEFVMIRDVTLGTYSATGTTLITDELGNTYPIYRGAAFPTGVTTGEVVHVLAAASKYNTTYQLRVGSSSDYIVANDTTGPTIVAPTLLPAKYGEAYPITLEVTDNVKVETVTVSILVNGALVGEVMPMTLNAETGKYEIEIPGSLINNSEFTFKFEATDVNGNAATPVEVAMTASNLPEVKSVLPAPNTATLDNKRPEIVVNFSNAGANPVVKLTLNNGETIDMVVVGEQATYTPTADLVDGIYEAGVTITRSEDSEVGVYTWKFTVGEALYNFYFGQIHSHTAEYSDGQGTLVQALEYARNARQIDFFAVTDHSNYFDSATQLGTFDNPQSGLASPTNPGNSRWATYKQQIEAANSADFVTFAGFEMTWSGGPGHINTFNTNGFVSRNNPLLNSKSSTHEEVLQRYYALLKEQEGSFSQFNHPGNTFGTFNDFAYWDPAIDAKIQLLEVGNGEGLVGSSGYWPSYQYYTQALDKGWKLAPSNGQDNHKGKWGDSNTTRTVVIANELTRSSLTQAIHDLMVYSTEDDNFEVYFTANGLPMGSSFAESPETIDFIVNLNDPDAGDNIAKLEVVTSGGIVAHTQTVGSNTATLNFTLPNTSAYYYLRITQTDGQLIVTAPVWTGQTTMVGINKVTKNTAMEVIGEPVTVTTELYNYEGSDLVVENVRYTINERVVGEFTTELPTIVSNSTGNITHTITPDRVGEQFLMIEITGLLNGLPVKFSSSIKLNVYDSSQLIKIGVDAFHDNFYVSGDYSGSDANFIAVAAQLGAMVEHIQEAFTFEKLSEYDIVVLTVPYLGFGKGGKEYTDAEVAALAQYAANGGNIVLTSKSDRGNADGIQNASEVSNRLLEAIGAKARIADGIVVDNDRKENEAYRLNFVESINFNEVDELSEGIFSDTTGTFTSYNAAPVLANGANEIVVGYPTTWGASYVANFTGSAYVPNYETDTIVVPKGEVAVVTTETLGGGGFLVTSGVTFFSTFEVKTEMLQDRDTRTANYRLVQNIIELAKPEPTITPIAEVHAATEGKFFTIEGTLTSNASGYDTATAFFDSAYVQDATGGINIFPIAGNYQAGQKVRISGTTSSYNGERQLNIAIIDVIDETVNPLQPTLMTTAEVKNNLGLLVKVEGTITNIVEKDGVIESITVQDETGEIIVFIDGYIMPTYLMVNMEVGNQISAIGLSSISVNDIGEPIQRIRVRDRSEVVATPVGPVTHQVTLNANGGTFVEGTQTTFEVVHGEVYKTPYPFSVKLTNPGYTFAGWLVEGTETVYAYPTEITVNADTVLVAQWEVTSGDFIIHDYTEGHMNLDKSRTFKLVAEDGTEYLMTSDRYNIDRREWRANDVPNGTYDLVVMQNGEVLSRDWTLEKFGQVDTTSSYVINEDGTITFNLEFADDKSTTFIRYELNTVPVVVTSIEVTPPTTLDYWNGDTLVMDGITLTAHYSDGTSQVVEVTPEMLSGYDFTLDVYGKQVVTATYQGMTDTFDVYYNLFSDITHTHWAYETITDAANLRIIKGFEDGTFRPNGDLTRAQAVAMLVRSLGVEIPTGRTSIFSDLADNNWATDYIMYAVDQGIVSGYADGTFRSAAPITRGELAKIVAKTYNLQINPDNIKTFSDIPTTHWAYAYIQALASNNVVSGFEDGTYGANKYATRAEFTKFIMNALEVYNK